MNGPQFMGGPDIGQIVDMREEQAKQLRMACMQMAGALAQTLVTHSPEGISAAAIVREAEILRVYVETGARKAS